MSATAPLPAEHPSADRRRPRPALVIDGEAVVLSRQTVRHDVLRAIAPPPAPTPDAAARTSSAPGLEARRDGDARSAFGRRSVGRRAFAPDLVFQGASRANGPVSPAAGRRGLSVFTDAAGFGRGADERRMAGLAVLLAVFALPVLILSAPIAPAEATPAADALAIDQLVTSIVPRGTGAVLTVDGRIRNVSGTVTAILPVRIALAEPDGARRSKSVMMPGVSSLQAGRSVRFHSTIAVAKDTRGEIEVDLLAPTASSGKTSIE